MDEDALNMEIRRFLKQVGVTSQRAIERAVSEAAGKVKAGDTIEVTATITAPTIELTHEVRGKLTLSD